MMSIRMGLNILQARLPVQLSVQMHWAHSACQHLLQDARTHVNTKERRFCPRLGDFKFWP